MFSKRWLINYLLITLIIIFTWIGKNYPPQQPQMDNGNAITRLKAQDINSIKIETADSIVQLSKQGGSWTINSPIQWFANNIAVERLATLATLEARSQIARSEIDLSTLGLSLPKAVVTLNQQSIYFGDSNRIGNRRYLLVEPNIYLVDDIHYPFISQGLGALLDRRLLPASLQLDGLQMSGLSLRYQQGQWVSDNPEHDPEALKQLVNQWQTKQASSIKPYDVSLTPLQKITANTKTSGPIEFYLLSIKPEIIIARPDLNLQYHFPDHQYYELLSVDKPAG